MKRFEFKIHGPIKGGKNHVMITRTGHRYPNPKWASWRDQVVRKIREVCKPTVATMITKPCQMWVLYTPYDLKRRDLPAMLDSIFHCLEKAGIVEDDCLIHDLKWSSWPKDKDNAGASIIVEEI